MSDFSENDARRLWQEQPSGPSTMTETEILSRARRLQFNARAEVLGISAVTVGMALLLFMGSLFEVLGRRGATVNLWSFGWLVCTALLVPCFVLVSHTFYTFLWPRPFIPECDVSESLLFCRRELQRRQDFSHVLWRRSIPLLCICVAMIVLAGIRSIVVGTLGAMSVAGVVALGLWMRKRDTARIESQLIELNLMGSTTGGDPSGRGNRSGRRHPSTLTLVLIWLLILVTAVVIYSLVGPSR